MSITCVDMCGTDPNVHAFSLALAHGPADPVAWAMRAARLVELQRIFADFALEAKHPDAERVVLHLGGCPIRVDPAVPADEIWLVQREGPPFKIVHLRAVVAPMEPGPCPHTNRKDKGSYDKCLDCGERFVPSNVWTVLPGGRTEP